MLSFVLVSLAVLGQPYTQFDQVSAAVFEELKPYLLGLVLPDGIAVIVPEGKTTVRAAEADFTVGAFDTDVNGDLVYDFDANIRSELGGINVRVRVRGSDVFGGSELLYVSADYAPPLQPKGAFFYITDDTAQGELELVQLASVQVCVCEAGGGCSDNDCYDQKTCGIDFASCIWVQRRTGGLPPSQIGVEIIAVILFVCICIHYKLRTPRATA